MAFSLALLGASTYEVPVALGSYDLLATEILTGTSSSITFASLGTYAADYQHLQVRATLGRSTSGGDMASGKIKLNGSDMTKSHLLRGYNGSVNSYDNTVGKFTYAGTGSTHSGLVIDVLDAFSSDKNTTIRFLGGVAGNSEPFVMLNSAFWDNTSSITSLEINGGGPSFTENSRLSLYGIRKAA